ncbi:hypothetical protein S7711_01026 [Stachybotrys chartarum IBT 7711]|uniref:GTP cyclohydrolase 1 n=1 Tax=Stachybotrys chartarum (strain CBS 109288 / IBT 7711) TaxID=1280523 RepID=A0A084B465_STACB|nr:hypothetical protein S7711_01026 [Stachybotrys chartarum IBT 7711]KFA80323.1 hypothetical protein S40288_05893 [Stachybotrys chartarum IBT 40288]
MTDSDTPRSGDKKPKKNGVVKKRQNNEPATPAAAALPNGPSAVNDDSHAARRSSISRPSRDLRDEPPAKRRRRSRHRRSREAQAKADEGKPKAPTEADSLSNRSESPFIDFDGLSRPSRGTRERVGESKEQAALRLDRMKGAVTTLLECIGENPDRPGILDTPKRYAEAMLWFTKGYQENVRDIVNGAIFQEGHNELIIVKDIEVFSMCEHHMVPFTGKMHIGYIPNNAVIGLSKLPRIAEMFARRLQIQERLTKEVANAIFEVLQPQGVAVVMESSHLCMVMRGVEKTSATTITSCVLGCFERREKTRNEFLSLVGVNRR